MPEFWLTRKELRQIMVRVAGFHFLRSGNWLDRELEILQMTIRDHYPADLYYRGEPVSVPRSLRRWLGRYVGVRDAKTAANPG